MLLDQLALATRSDLITSGYRIKVEAENSQGVLAQLIYDPRGRTNTPVSSVGIKSTLAPL